MKRKVSLILLSLVLVSLLVVVLALCAMAEDGEVITVSYQWYSGETWDTATPNEDGSFTLRTNKKSGNATVKLADGTTVDREFYGWFDREGNLYEPGQTVFFEKSTALYEAYGITVYTAEDLKATIGHCYVKLGADITVTEQIGKEWTTDIINLNGYTFTSTAKSTAIYVKRGSFVVHGNGKFIHAPSTVGNHIDERTIYFEGHGYGDHEHPQNFWIGKGVEFITPYSVLYEQSFGRDNMPKMVIAGTIEARTLARINPALKEGYCYITKDAVITVKDNLFEFKNQTGVTEYLTVTLDGVINVANGTLSVFTDFVREKVPFVINGGKFCFAETDAEYISYYIKDDQKLIVTTEGDLTWYEIVPSDCVHEWIKNEELSVAPTLEATGLDVLKCGICGVEKIVHTVFDPSNTEIDITFLGENGETINKTVLAGDVFEFLITGVGEKTKYSLVGLKDSEEFLASSVIAVEIPRGIGVIMATVVNESLQTINIKDGVDVSINSLEGFKALNTINIGAATVRFDAVKGNTSLESVVSNVPGANVVFANACFDGKTNLKYLTMSDGSSYTFGENSFRKTSIETLIFPDAATVSFAGGAAFYNAAVKYAYFGKSITSINNKPLDCALNLELVVIMSATYIDQYCFCVNDANIATSLLKVYCHSENVSLNGNAFINRMNYGVEFYTIDPDITSLPNCKYVVYNGIPHAYAEGVIKEPTCISTGIAGSTTDCVCNVNEVVSYKVYTADAVTDGTTEQRELPMVDIHVLGTTLADIKYKEGYLVLGTKEYFCALCNKATVEELTPSANALVVCKGYSICQYNDGGMVQSFIVNNEAYREYVSFNPEFEIGIVVAGNKAGTSFSPLIVEEGELVCINENVLSNEFDLSNYACFEVKVYGLNDTAKDTNIVLCAYTYDGDAIGYIDNGSMTDSIVGITYNSLVG